MGSEMCIRDSVIRHAVIYNYEIVSKAMHFYKWYSHKNDILVFLLAANALVDLGDQFV